MKLFKAHGSLLLASLLLIAGVFAVYPYYQYLVDPDATAYLTIAKRYVAGDYARAINGYWSPWAIWLTALLIKCGYAAFTSAIMVNTIGALCFLYISYSLFSLFKIVPGVRLLLSLTLVGFLVYAIFWQSFDDLWECFFLLAALRIMLKDDFTVRPSLWIATGALGALAYFAKAYAFPFFILNVLCCTYFISRAKDKQEENHWLKIAATTILVMVVCSSPWIYVLYEKYGRITTGTAGSLNMSWYLVGHPYWKEDIIHLLPPVYPDSPSYWEDPFIANGAAPQFYSSIRLFLLQGIRMVYNLLKLALSMNELSMFFAFTVVVALAILLSKQVKTLFAGRLSIVALSFLLFPLGYLLVNFQARYLWYMLPLSMLIGALTIQKVTFHGRSERRLVKAIMLLFAISFLATPVLGLKDMYRKGQREFETAEWMKKAEIHGSFTTNIPYGSRSQDIVRLAYFSGNPYYNMPLPSPWKGILMEMRRYNIKYYFHYKDADDVACQLIDESGQPFPEVTGGRLDGLRIYLVNPQ